jgi:hypothetical protein
LRFEISSSVALLGAAFSVDFCFLTAGLEGCRVSFLEVLLVGGVESMSMDISESLSSAGMVFCFFFGGASSAGDLGVVFFCASGEVAFFGVIGGALAGEDVGVSLMTFFFRFPFLATN